MARHLSAESRQEDSNRIGARESESQEPPQRVSTLLGDIIGDVQKLVRQEMGLAGAELRQEWAKTKEVAAGYLVSAALVFVALFLLGIAFAQGLIALRLSGWGAYTLAAALFGGVGLVLFKRAREQPKGIETIAEPSVDSIKEKSQWIRKPN